jgi:hypothetical protein
MFFSFSVTRLASRSISAVADEIFANRRHVRRHRACFKKFSFFLFKFFFKQNAKEKLLPYAV